MMIQLEKFGFYENMVNIERKISNDIFHCLFCKYTLIQKKNALTSHGNDGLTKFIFMTIKLGWNVIAIFVCINRMEVELGS